MPCMGPEGPSEEEVQHATEKVIEFLGSEFDVFNPLPDNTGTFGGWLTSFYSRNRQKAFEKLKQGVYEVLWQDACEKF